MTELYLARHALPVGGEADPGLSPEGVDQAKRLAAWLETEGIDAIVTSPALRARQTTALIEERLGLRAPVIDDLREWDRDLPVGAYTPVEEMAADDPRSLAIAEGRFDEFVPQLDVPAFQRRVTRVLGEIFDRFRVGRVLVSTHGGLINAYLAHVIGVPRIFWFNPGYASVSRVEKLASGRVVVRSVNETAYLAASRP
jgi:probable phosphoglycerate mutase